MEKNKIKESVKGILIPILEHEDIDMSDETRVKEIEGWTSLANVVILSEIEKAFNIKFKLKELDKLDSVGAIIELITSKIQA